MANHISYADVLVLASLTPIRFLAKAEIRAWPIIGMAAQAIGCVFVKRQNRTSRSEARSSLATIDRHPPIVVFPEGQRSPGGEIRPFRYGGFRVATEGSIPLLPCAIVYRPWDVLALRAGETMPQTMWRLTSFAGPIQVEVIPLAVVHPQPNDEPAHLAEAIQDQIVATIQKYKPTPQLAPSHTGSTNEPSAN